MLAGFFGRIVRLIAESLPNAAAVIAVHDTYLSNSNYRDATGFLESRITLPLIPTAAGLGQIVALRARRGLQTGEHVALNDIIDDSALQRLYGNYQAAGPSLRNQLQIMHGSLAHACDEDSEVISTSHIDQAITD